MIIPIEFAEDTTWTDIEELYETFQHIIKDIPLKGVFMSNRKAEKVKLD